MHCQWPAAPGSNTKPFYTDGLSHHYCDKTEGKTDCDALAGKPWYVADTCDGRPHLEAESNSQTAQENKGILGSGGNYQSKTTDNNNTDTTEQFLGTMTCL